MIEFKSKIVAEVRGLMDQIRRAVVAEITDARQGSRENIAAIAQNLQRQLEAKQAEIDELIAHIDSTSMIKEKHQQLSELSDLIYSEFQRVSNILFGKASRPAKRELPKVTIKKPSSEKKSPEKQPSKKDDELTSESSENQSEVTSEKEQLKSNEFSEQIAAFKKILRAIRKGQTSMVNTNFMANKSKMEDDVLHARILAHVKKFPKGRVAKAWKLAKDEVNQKFCHDDKNITENLPLFRKIYKTAFKHSGMFKQSKLFGVTLFSYKSLKKRMDSAEDNMLKSKIEKMSNKNKKSRSAKIVKAF